MKCPKCKTEGMVNRNSPSCVIYRKYWCGLCNHEWDERKLIDSAGLLDLMEKVFARMPWTSAIYEQGLEDGLEAVKSLLLNGDPSALLKLAGGK